jgi:soluble lytic murein transglycosylase-like protein
MKRGFLLALLAAGCSFASDLSPRTYEERCAELYARQCDVPVALVRAIIDVESGWQPGAVSPKGAIGLMQLMPATAREYGVEHPFWIHENIRGGVVYLRSLLDEFQGDLRLTVAAYYTGSRRIRTRGLAYGNRPVFEYVQAVAARYREELGRRVE